MRLDTSGITKKLPETFAYTNEKRNKASNKNLPA
jgi:hypothetical protein